MTTKMKACEGCGITVRAHKRCPLCQGPLIEAEEGAQADPFGRPYPSYRKQRRRMLLWRLIAMLVVLSSAVSVLINMANPGPHTPMIIGYVIGGAACVLLEMGLLLSMRGSIARIISDQALIVGTLCVIWDVATGFRGWSTEYVLPLLLVSALAAIQVIRLCARQSFSDYGIRVLGLSVLCIALPQVLGMGWPGIVCAIGGVFSVLELIFLEGRKLMSEISRRFHL